MANDRERVLVIPRWAADLAKEELGRELNASEVPPLGFWDRIEIAEPVELEGCWNCGGTEMGCCMVTAMY